MAGTKIALAALILFCTFSNAIILCQPPNCPVIPTVKTYLDVTLDPAQGTTPLYIYNLSDKYEKTGIPNALVIRINLTNVSNPKPCYEIANEVGWAILEYEPYAIGCHDYWYIYCPLGDAWNNKQSREQCLNSTGLIEIINNDIPKCADSNTVYAGTPPSSAATNQENILSHNELYYCNKESKDWAFLCWPLMTILALLMGASFAMGRNPLGAFDMSSLRMNRGRLYTPRMQNKQFDYLAIAMAAASAIDTGVKVGKVAGKGLKGATTQKSTGKKDASGNAIMVDRKGLFSKLDGVQGWNPISKLSGLAGKGATALGKVSLKGVKAAGKGIATAGKSVGNGAAEAGKGFAGTKVGGIVVNMVKRVITSKKKEGGGTKKPESPKKAPEKTGITKQEKVDAKKEAMKKEQGGDINAKATQHASNVLKKAIIKQNKKAKNADGKRIYEKKADYKKAKKEARKEVWKSFKEYRKQKKDDIKAGKDNVNGKALEKKKAKNNVNDLKKEVKKLDNDVKKGTATQGDLDKAKADLDKAKNTLTTAAKDLKLARQELQGTKQGARAALWNALAKVGMTASFSIAGGKVGKEKEDEGKTGKETKQAEKSETQQTGTEGKNPVDESKNNEKKPITQEKPNTETERKNTADEAAKLKLAASGQGGVNAALSAGQTAPNLLAPFGKNMGPTAMQVSFINGVEGNLAQGKTLLGSLLSAYFTVIMPKKLQDLNSGERIIGDKGKVHTGALVKKIWAVYSAISLVSFNLKVLAALKGKEGRIALFDNAIDKNSVGKIGTYNISLAELSSWMDADFKRGSGVPFGLNWILPSMISGFGSGASGSYWESKGAPGGIENGKLYGVDKDGNKIEFDNMTKSQQRDFVQEMKSHYTAISRASSATIGDYSSKINRLENKVKRMEKRGEDASAIKAQIKNLKDKQSAAASMAEFADLMSHAMKQVKKGKADDLMETASLHMTAAYATLAKQNATEVMEQIKAMKVDEKNVDEKIKKLEVEIKKTKEGTKKEELESQKMALKIFKGVYLGAEGEIKTLENKIENYENNKKESIHQYEIKNLDKMINEAKSDIETLKTFRAYFGGQKDAKKEFTNILLTGEGDIVGIINKQTDYRMRTDNLGPIDNRSDVSKLAVKKISQDFEDKANNAQFNANIVSQADRLGFHSDAMAAISGGQANNATQTILGMINHMSDHGVGIKWTNEITNMLNPSERLSPMAPKDSNQVTYENQLTLLKAIMDDPSVKEQMKTSMFSDKIDLVNSKLDEFLKLGAELKSEHVEKLLQGVGALWYTSSTVTSTDIGKTGWFMQSPYMRDPGADAKQGVFEALIGSTNLSTATDGSVKYDKSTTFTQTMQGIQEKAETLLTAKKDTLDEAKTAYKEARKEYRHDLGSTEKKNAFEAAEKDYLNAKRDYKHELKEYGHLASEGLTNTITFSQENEDKIKNLKDGEKVKVTSEEGRSYVISFDASKDNPDKGTIHIESEYTKKKYTDTERNASWNMFKGMEFPEMPKAGEPPKPALQKEEPLERLTPKQTTEIPVPQSPEEKLQPYATPFNMSNVTRYVMTWNRDKESTDEYAGRNLGGTRAQKDAEAAKQYMIERGWAKEEDFQSGKLNEAQEKAIYAIAQTQYRMSYLKQKAGGDPFAKYGSVDDFSKAVFDKETGKSELSTVIAEKKGSQEWYGKAFEKLSKKLEEDNKQ